MKNSDMPAMPTIYADMAANGQREIYCDQTGLTKREEFAKTALLGILFDTEYCKNKDAHDLATLAIIHADALLAELERAK